MSQSENWSYERKQRLLLLLMMTAASETGLQKKIINRLIGTKISVAIHSLEITLKTLVQTLKPIVSGCFGLKVVRSESWVAWRRKKRVEVWKKWREKFFWRKKNRCLKIFYSMWYDFCELRVIMVRCSSTDRVTAVRWTDVALCVTDDDDVEYFCLNDDLPPSLSVPLPLPVADLKRSIDSWKLGPLSMVLRSCCSELRWSCCCCWTCCWNMGRLVLNGDDEYFRKDPSS